MHKLKMAAIASIIALLLAGAYYVEYSDMSECRSQHSFMECLTIHLDAIES